MLRSTEEMQGYTLRARDGDIGTVADFYFDDERWALRYLVADTGSWLTGRSVLISPLAIAGVDWGAERLDLTLTREQVERSPDIDTDRPVSRQHELEYYNYYGWAPYWGGAGLWGPVAYPPAPVPAAMPAPAPPVAERERGDSHLRSAKEVRGYTIGALDGEIGRVGDFIVDDRDWAIRYLVVDTGGWLSGRSVLVTPQWIAGVSWEGARVDIDLTRDTIRNSPEFDPSRPVERDYEARLHDHYGRPAYWA